jgi:threonyl-tRNA synthetase
MLIVGEKEQDSNSVSVRKHKHGDQGSTSLEDFTSKIKDEIDNKIVNNQ